MGRDSDDNWEDVPVALVAFDGALGLSRPGAARLVVIVSDGDYRYQPASAGSANSTGCARPGAPCCG